eukprot:Colp12_sorted_trinity150504_noHs@1398
MAPPAVLAPPAPTHAGGNIFSLSDQVVESFRNYESSARDAIVRQTYRLMHINQTYEFVMKKREEWLKLNHAEMSMMDAVFLLNGLVDDSDPDVDFPNSYHAFQTAERCRQLKPDDDWFHLVGFIHDVGKVLSMWGEPQWSAVGDTFPVGCKFSEKCVHSQFFSENADSADPRYNTDNGIYQPGCGIDNLVMSWGHDEYLYHVLKLNNSTIPEMGLRVIRFHSFYPWHTSNAYTQFMNEEDHETLKWVRDFNQFDLYSKADELPDMEALKPYYQSLIDKYCPGKLRW